MDPHSSNLSFKVTWTKVIASLQNKIRILQISFLSALFTVLSSQLVKSALLQGDIIFITLDSTQTCPLLLFKAVHYTNMIEKIVRNKEVSALACKMCRNGRYTWRILWSPRLSAWHHLQTQHRDRGTPHRACRAHWIEMPEIRGLGGWGSWNLWDRVLARRNLCREGTLAIHIGFSWVLAKH